MIDAKAHSTSLPICPRLTNQSVPGKYIDWLSSQVALLDESVHFARNTMTGQSTLAFSQNNIRIKFAMS